MSLVSLAGASVPLTHSPQEEKALYWHPCGLNMGVFAKKDGAEIERLGQKIAPKHPFIGHDNQ
jgi:hypothetical protein